MGCNLSIVAEATCAEGKLDALQLLCHRFEFAAELLDVGDHLRQLGALNIQWQQGCEGLGGAFDLSQRGAPGFLVARCFNTVFVLNHHLLLIQTQIAHGQLQAGHFGD